MKPRLPKAILLDLDDTILDDSGPIDACWQEACRTGALECGLSVDILYGAIRKTSAWYWSDPERHRVGRLDLQTARTEVVRLALADLGLGASDLADKIGRIYHDKREASLEIFPDAVETLEWLREQGCRLALLTNGNGSPQRRKIETFGLAPYFDAIFIEGEVGFGKPDERIYRLALGTLEVEPSQAWMAGDNLEWDVEQPQKLGIFAIWIDAAGAGHAKLAQVKPDRIIRKLSELKH
jgi:putative hydrolase of the HAD superfamily